MFYRCGGSRRRVPPGRFASDPRYLRLWFCSDEEKAIARDAERSGKMLRPPPRARGSERIGD